MQTFFILNIGGKQMASTYNFPTHIKGDTFDGAQFTLSLNGSAIDLTDAIITMDMRLTPSGVSVKRLTSVGDADITIGTPASDGIFTINNQIIDVDAGKYYYDIQTEFPDGTVKTYIQGIWLIIQDVTYD